MPPITRKDGRPLIPRVGSKIPFKASEEKDHFRRIQDLIVEFNCRSQKRISATLVSSDGSVLLLGTKSVISTILTSNVVSATVTALRDCPDWFCDEETETFKVPLIHLPSKEELLELDESACEGVIANMLNKSNYPCVNHFGKNHTTPPNFWPTDVTPKAPSAVSLRDNRTGIKFATRRAFLLFIFEAMMYAYFRNLLFVKFGVIIDRREDCSYISSQIFSTEFPFDIRSAALHSREVLPCPRKVNGIDRAMERSASGQDAAITIKEGPCADGLNDMPLSSPIRVTTQDNQENPLLKSAVAKKAATLKGMPYLKDFDSPVQDENTQEGRVVRTAVPRVLKLRRYKRTNNGKEAPPILCTCRDRLDLSLIQTVRCTCGNLTHVACVSNAKGTCLLCSSK